MNQTNTTIAVIGEQQAQVIKKLLGLMLDKTHGVGGVRAIDEFERGVRQQHGWMKQEIERICGEQRHWKPDSAQGQRWAAARTRQEQAAAMVESVILPMVIARKEVEHDKWNANARIVVSLREHVANELREWGLTDVLA